MNYYAARQRSDDKRWRYTRQNDGVTWECGYCIEFKPWTAETMSRFMSSEGAAVEAARLNAKYEPLKGNYHSDGHATKEEAEACYRKFLLDTQLRIDLFNKDQQEKCAACDAWTQKAAMVDTTIFHLCDEHLTREQVERLYPAVGSIISSY